MTPNDTRPACLPMILGKAADRRANQGLAEFNEIQIDHNCAAAALENNLPFRQAEYQCD